jgi:predicted nucleic acid-binding protein
MVPPTMLPHLKNSAASLDRGVRLLALGRGVELAIELKQHLFDTFYHAVALETPNTTLITADERYLRAARSKGQIIDLMDWQ